MTDKDYSDLWQRLNDWVDGKEPEIQEHREEPVHEIRSTQELEIEERRTIAARKRVFGGKPLIDRYSEWENGSGILFFNRLHSLMAFTGCIAVVSVMLLLTVSYLPPFGDPANPANNEVFTKYTQDALSDTNATNVVAGIILDYRAFDTFGESSVLFAAACAVIMLLRNDGKVKGKRAPPASCHAEAQQGVILSTVSALVVPILLLYGIYVILNGHISPGGGFSGGTIIGAGLILLRGAFGAETAARIISARTYTRVTFSALCFYALAKGYSFFTGANHIESAIPKGTPGAILSGGLILPLNIAVGLVVACTMYGFYALYDKGEI